MTAERRGSGWVPPEAFEEYRLVRELGRGAMGQVWLAHDTLLDRPVAVKFVSAGEIGFEARERFFVEARAVARLQHPNVVAVYRVGEIRGRPYLVSELLRGESLDKLDRPVSPTRVAEIGVQLARGLASAHRRGVLHRDIKSANAMLTEDGTVKLLDFGLAKVLDDGVAPEVRAGPGQPAPGVGERRRAEPGADGPPGSPTNDGPATMARPSAGSDDGAGAEATLDRPPPPGPQCAESGDAPPADPGVSATFVRGRQDAAPDSALASAGSPPGAGDDEAPGVEATLVRRPGAPAPSQSGPGDVASLALQLSARGAPVSDSEADGGDTDGSGREADPERERATRTLERSGDGPPPAGNLPPAAALEGFASPSRGHGSNPSLSPSLTQQGAIMGSPLYMAPEAWRGEPATPRTDVFSLGVVLFELAAGRAPLHGLSVSEISVALRERDLPSLGERAPGVPRALVELVDRCLARNPEQRFESGDALREALERLLAPARSTRLPEGNPYRGLLAFEAEHRSLFFGRAGEVRGILDRLRSEPFLLIAGDSGVGKSSLCRAGVLPAVEEGGLEGDGWTTATMVPGRRPLSALAATLAPLLEREEAELAAQLRDEPQELGRALRTRFQSGGGLVIFIDQLEELVTLAEPEEAARVAEALGSLTLRARGLRAVATARSDFLGRLAGLPAIGEELARAIYLLRPLTLEGVREAVVGPAEALGYRFETEAMVDSLVESATGEGGSLPLLQFALAELWNVRDERAHVIPARALVDMGGVAGALAKHADGVLARLLPEQRAAARRILLKLVTGQSTRARRTGEELVGELPAARAALEELVHGRLLVARDSEEEDGIQGAYEVAHEALITGWATLQGWLSSSAETRAARERLGTAAAEWERLGRSREALWGRRQIAESERIAAEELGRLEERFLVASRERLQSRRRRQILTAIALPSLVLLILGGLRMRAQLEEDREIHGRLTQAERLMDEARSAERELQGWREEAFELFDALENQEAEELWAKAQARTEQVQGLYSRAGGVLENALLIAPDRADTRRMLAELLFARVQLASRERDRLERAEHLTRLKAFDAEGALVEALLRPAQIELGSSPPGAEVTLSYYGRDDSRFVEEGREVVGRTPLRLEVEPRSLLLELSAPGFTTARIPILPAAGERLERTVALLPEERLPEGFVFVPGGRFLYGADESDSLRTSFMNAQPMRPVQVEPFLIQATEVTFAEWLAFLRDLPDKERALRTPSVLRALRSSTLHLGKLPDGSYRLRMRPNAKEYTAKEGEPIVYPGRTRRQSQDWLRLPVTAITYEDALAYVGWLDRTGRVPGARLCREQEWELAARGADGRPYPCGDLLSADQANFDITYDRHPLAFGPDEVGSYPHCSSPFGVHDTSANVWEWMQSSGENTVPVFRSGSFYEGALSARIANRNIGEAHLKDALLGMRVCADLTQPDRGMQAAEGLEP